MFADTINENLEFDPGEEAREVPLNNGVEIDGIYLCEQDVDCDRDDNLGSVYQLIGSVRRPDLEYRLRAKKDDNSSPWETLAEADDDVTVDADYALIVLRRADSIKTISVWPTGKVDATPARLNAL